MGGSSIERPRANPPREWVEEVEYARALSDFGPGEHFFSDRQLEDHLNGLRRNFEGRPLTKRARKAAGTVMSELSSRFVQDHRMNMVFEIAAFEMAELYERMVPETRNPFFPERETRWRHLATERAKLIIRRQGGMEA
ncbi:hypothetical protein [Arenibacterium halophilum]|uniref:Uncharacterized protein n=1 Tax=Arenibacterium halophilum TaxID=2583821 RepID=A0ABY2XD98_9RHOB|nr:hypothetical protein [Arenibacterium halophilum]TMV14591.1 hypothetical protein FGK64_00965 [Arenibacterium halophilum]